MYFVEWVEMKVEVDCVVVFFEDVWCVFGVQFGVEGYFVFVDLRFDFEWEGVGWYWYVWYDVFCDCWDCVLLWQIEVVDFGCRFDCIDEFCKVFVQVLWVVLDVVCYDFGVGVEYEFVVWCVIYCFVVVVVYCVGELGDV